MMPSSSVSFTQSTAGSAAVVASQRRCDACARPRFSFNREWFVAPSFET